MLAIGAGGLDVAVAMGGGAYYITMPKMVRVNLTGKLSPWVSAKDIILAVLRVMSVKGGVGKIVEYGGEGVATLTVPERATITNMGAELGATTSVFPSDETTRKFLKAQGREEDYTELKADDDAVYDEVIEINLSELEPLAACPHSPDNVKTIKELEGNKIDQVCIGSCTNSSYLDLMRVAHILKGKKVADNVSLAIAPGSKQVFNMLALNGALGDMIAAGARILRKSPAVLVSVWDSHLTAAVFLLEHSTVTLKAEAERQTVRFILYLPKLQQFQQSTAYLQTRDVLVRLLRLKCPKNSSSMTIWLLIPLLLRKWTA